MQRAKAELSEVFDRCDKNYISSLSRDKRKVHDAVVHCRTSKLGAHIKRCPSCNYREQSYNSCRNRHCPKCQGSVSAQWTQDRNRELLPVEYFHSVFTIPKELRLLCYQNKEVFYDLMFKCVSESLQQVAANPKFLGAKIGFVTILHTWNQQLGYHPHIHIISPKGGISKDNTEWIAPRGNFYLPVRALSKVYRGKLLDGLRALYKERELKFFGAMLEHSSKNDFEKLLSKSRNSEWVVYSKKSFGGPTQVVKYLSCYVHRIAISNHRIKSVKGDQVTFSYRDSKNNCKKRLKTLHVEEFSKRFLRHTLPKNFTRIRHYGFLASAHKAKYLELARRLLKDSKAQSTAVRPFKMLCPSCHSSELEIVSITMIPHRASPRRPKHLIDFCHPPPDRSLAA